jgi:hypothetical protein
MCSNDSPTYLLIWIISQDEITLILLVGSAAERSLIRFSVQGVVCRDRGEGERDLDSHLALMLLFSGVVRTAMPHNRRIYRDCQHYCC